jgi:flagellar hook-associated protein 1 FlgK
MAGISTTLDIARLALVANQYGLTVTGQNIANADNANYSRQLMELDTAGSVSIHGLVFGRGVEVTQIKGAVDASLQSWMDRQQSILKSYEEMTKSLDYIEDIFSLDTENALDVLFSDFWNSWSALSNIPDGTAERSAVLESGEAIVAQFNSMSDNMNALSATITDKIEVAVDTINKITTGIYELNKSIVAIEAQEAAVANDSRDERAALVAKLSELLNITTYEQGDGSLLVTTANGSAILVGSGGPKELSVDTGQIMWESTGGSVDISDQVTGGSIGGWLNIRDEVIPEYQANLNELVQAFIWNVNTQHAQGVGLSYFSDVVTGSYAVDTTTTNALDTLDFFSDVDLTGDFSIWVADSSGPVTTYTETVLNFAALGITGASTMTDLATAFNGAVTGVTASVTAGRLVLTPDSVDYQFAIGGDDSGMASAIGLNTFFTGGTIDDMGIHEQIYDTDNICAAQVETATGDIAAGDNTNALLMAECGEISVDIILWNFERGGTNTFSTITTSTDSYYRNVVSALGITSAAVDRNRETSESLMSELQTRRDSVSAVSLDEEMINLVKYQNAYGAASKLFKVADEMLDTLIQMR